MDPVVTALAASSTPEPHFGTDDRSGDMDDEVAQHTNAASEGDSHDHSNDTAYTITEYQLLHRAVFSPAEGTEEVKQLLDKGTDIDCTDHAGA